MIIRFGGNFLDVLAFRFVLFILRLSKEAVKRNSSGNNLFRRVSKFIEAMTEDFLQLKGSSLAYFIF